MLFSLLSSADMDEEPEVDVPHLRKALKKIEVKLKKHHTRFTKTLAEDSPATTDFHALEEAHKAVESLQKEYNKK